MLLFFLGFFGHFFIYLPSYLSIYFNEKQIGKLVLGINNISLASSLYENVMFVMWYNSIWVG